MLAYTVRIINLQAPAQWATSRWTPGYGNPGVVVYRFSTMLVSANSAWGINLALKKDSLLLYAKHLDDNCSTN